jgi:hypothetical protein
MSNMTKGKNKRLLNEMLLYVAQKTDLRPSEMAQLVFEDADTEKNQITVRHPQTDRTFILQCDSAHGEIVVFLHDAWPDIDQL